MRESNTMQGKSLLERDELFRIGDTEKIWQKYCGFLDLSLEEFMAIQERLLLEQIDLAWNSKLGRKIMGNQKPKSVEEFRRIVPLTTYEDYEPYLSEKREDVLPEKPVIWAHTSGRTGFFKHVPYTLGNLSRLADDTISASILSAATRRGDVHVHEGVKFLHNLPPPPYTSGIMPLMAAQRISFHAFPPLEVSKELQFHERTKLGFKMALNSGLDFIGSLAVVLVKVGESLNQSAIKLPKLSSLHPMAILRLGLAKLRSKRNNRPLLPRDIWRIKGAICGGTDTEIYREQIAYYWGVQPLNIYVASEAGYIAMQGWNKKGLTFVPFNNFYEFIPKKEADKDHHPSTMLLDEVKEGGTYELVLTNFHGGPFLRYRIGDLIKISSLCDKEMGVNLPQMLFQSRVDDVIDISGFVRLDERTIWQAIQSIGIPYEDWCARKEFFQGRPQLHIYLELKGDLKNSQQIEELLDHQLAALDKEYDNLTQMIEIKPVKVTLLAQGTFEKYTHGKQAAGFDLAHLKPPHMNASDAIIEELLRLSRG